MEEITFILRLKARKDPLLNLLLSFTLEKQCQPPAITTDLILTDSHWHSQLTMTTSSNESII